MPISDIENLQVVKPALAAPRKVALVHFWLVGMRGGEKVLEALCRMYPQADIFTHVCDKDKISPFLQERNIYTTFIQKLPSATKHYQKYLPLMPLALEQLDLRDYDLVISSESGPAKGVLTHSDCTHVCYCHSPMRYLWDLYQDYLQSSSWPVRTAMRYFFHHLRLWDALSANRVDHFVANSKTVARRIRKHWRREASVVFPPIIASEFQVSVKPREDFYLCVGQLVDYKRVDIAINACKRLGRKLLIVGEGEAYKKWKTLSGQNIEFLGRIPSSQIRTLYATCAALLFPGEEDFGLVPVEAMASGTPIIAYGRGGATESVIANKTGLFFEDQHEDALCDAILAFEAMRTNFDAEVIAAHAQAFDEKYFSRQMFAEIEKAREQVFK